jgi:hypothetical protein
MTPRYLHTYKCSFCKVVAFSTVKNPAMSPLPCIQCHRYMAYQWSKPLTEAEWQARNVAPIEYRSPLPAAVVPPESRDRQCARRGCLVWKPPAELLNGRFCSEACGAQDSRDMAAFYDRLEQMYQEMPWLRPTTKPPSSETDSASVTTADLGMHQSR